MSGAGSCLSCSHACPILPLTGSLFVCLMNYLSTAPLPSWPPPPPGPSLHDLLNIARLCGCHPMSQEPPSATQPEYSLCPRPVQLLASLTPGGRGGGGVRHHIQITPRGLSSVPVERTWQAEGRGKCRQSLKKRRKQPKALEREDQPHGENLGFHRGPQPTERWQSQPRP